MTWLRWAVLAAMAGACCGCWQPLTPQRAEYQRGVVWLFPGIEGGAWQMEQPVRALRDAGVTSAVRVHDWWRPLNPLSNLVNYERNREQARAVAREIARQSRENRGVPVDLVGYSGGGGLALMVVESLPEGARVRDVILAQPAVSPTYDLTRALGRMDGRIVNLFCPSDWWTLGLGTSLLGTMDRAKTPSAGQVGFDLARAVPDARLRSRVTQQAWTPDARALGHWGNHTGMFSYGWNRHRLAPLLAARRAGGGTATSREESNE